MKKTTKTLLGALSLLGLAAPAGAEPRHGGEHAMPQARTPQPQARMPQPQPQARMPQQPAYRAEQGRPMVAPQYRGNGGREGWEGNRGYEGNRGFEGNRGYEGNRGWEGNRGYEGNRGWEGNREWEEREPVAGRRFGRPEMHDEHDLDRFRHRFHDRPGFRTYGFFYGLAPSLEPYQGLSFLNDGLLVGSYLAPDGRTIYVYLVDEGGVQRQYLVDDQGNVLSSEIVPY